MKSPDAVRKDIARRLANTWSTTLSGATPDAWPHPFPLSEPTKTQLETDFITYARQANDWRTWADGHHIELRWATRHVQGTTQQLPTHAVLTLADATRIVGDGWTDRVDRGRARLTRLCDQFPHLTDPAKLLRESDNLSDVDFDLLCRAGAWFTTGAGGGMTPRQVPIEGLHAKWLNTRQHMVRALAGRDDLGLAPAHPPRVHFTYLDPQYRREGGRVHDSLTLGDRVQLPYIPQVVVISENKDTAVWFPPTPGAVSVEGVGRGAGTIASVDWIRQAPLLVYWGDMDPDGLEILNEFRSAGLPAVSMLMDMAAYTQWERFGVSIDMRGRPLDGRPARPVEHLREGERDLYSNLVGPDWTRCRRIEQERIPLRTAHTTLLTLAGLPAEAR